MRSEEFEIVLRSLDRKIDQYRDPRSKAMCLVVQMGENSLCENQKAHLIGLLLKLLNFKYT